MTYIPLNQLKVYQLCEEYSDLGWEVYKEMDWQTKIIVT